MYSKDFKSDAVEPTYNSDKTVKEIALDERRDILKKVYAVFSKTQGGNANLQ